MRFSMLRNGSYLAALLLVTGLLLEVLSRIIIGLGDPPIVILDSKIEYMIRPSSSYVRWGNVIEYNAFGMRSPEINSEKSPDTYRVMLLGDSVLNGGPAIGQNETIPYVLRRIAPSICGQSTEFLSVSCGGWGARNMLEYLRKFGTFGADQIILLLNSTDAVDVASYLSDYGPDFPLKKPLSAAVEGFERYLPRFLPFDVWWMRDRRLRTILPKAKLLEQAREDLTELLNFIKSRNIPLNVAIHFGQTEHPDAHLENIEFLEGTLARANVKFKYFNFDEKS